MTRLPEFLIIGAQRGGTTSLYDYLTQHPRVAAAKRKEVHYFDLRYANGIGWYRSQFPWWLNIRRSMITGEGSPYYIFHPEVPDRVRETLPGVKIIVLLRDPVERALSHYQLIRRREREPLSFEEAMRAEPQRLAGEAERLRDPNYRSFAHQHQSYLSRGIYVDQLVEWKARFPWERFLVMKSEDLFADPAATLRRTLEFLGLEPIELATYEARNQATYERKLDPETLAYLEDYYRPHNRRLYELLGSDLGWPA